MISYRKFFFAWHEEKEKDFIEEKAKEGLELVSVGLFKYNFKQSVPSETKYSFDFRSFDKMSEDEYLQLYEDAGWTYVCRYGGWYYFKNDGEHSVELFSNYQSIKQKYQRLLLFLLITGFPLYYQALVLIPSLEVVEFPSFYGILKWIVYPLTILHAFALIKIFNIYIRYKDKIKE